MKRLITTITILTCFVATTWAVAGDPRTKLAQVAGNHRDYTNKAQDNQEMAAIPRPEPTMLAEIRAAMDSTRRAELALREEFGPEQGPEFARRLGNLKKTSRMRILHIQLKYAREEGRAELVRRIQTSIEDLQRPMAPGGPRLNGRNAPSPAAD